MVNFSNNTLSTLNKLVNQKSYKKILIISGRTSYFASGAEKLLKQTLKSKETYLLLKRSKYPEIKELKKIIKDPLFKKNSKVIKFSDKLFLKKFLFYKMQNKNFSIKNLNIKNYYYRFIYILIKILPKFLLKKLQYSF